MSKTWNQIQRIKKMTTYNIEIEGLPDGWKPVAYRIPKNREKVFIQARITTVPDDNAIFPCLIIEKIQPRRIVLEETDQNVPVGSMVPVSDCPVLVMCTDKIWRVKEE